MVDFGNSDLPAGFLNAPTGYLQPGLIHPGFDGELRDMNGKLVMQVNQFHAQINVNNSGYRPSGRPLEYAIMQSYSWTLTFTETVINDAFMLQPFILALSSRDANGLRKRPRVPRFNFQGYIWQDEDIGNFGAYVFRGLVADGNNDFMNVQVGQEISRAWSFRSNREPEILQMLTSTNPAD